MSHQDEGFVPLPAYAARASFRSGLLLDPVQEGNRSTIVFSGIGPENVPILFRADGIVIFEFDKSADYSGGAVDPYFVDDEKGAPQLATVQNAAREALQQRRFKYMNAFLSCFHVAANRSNKLAPPLSSDYYIWARHEHGGWSLMDNGAGLVMPLPFPGISLDLETLVKGLSAFQQIDGDEYEFCLETLGLFYRAAFNLNHHEFRTVLVLGWTIIEGGQEVLWKQFVNGGYKRINPHSEIKGKRKELLLDDRNYTASIKSQILGLAGEYSDSELERIDKVRRRRNSFMHSMKPVSMSDAFEAMWACGVVAKKAVGLTLQPFGNPGGWDYKR